MGAGPNSNTCSWVKLACRPQSFTALWRGLLRWTECEPPAHTMTSGSDSLAALNSKSWFSSQSCSSGLPVGLLFDLKLYVWSQESCRKQAGLFETACPGPRKNKRDITICLHEIQDVTNINQSCKSFTVQSLVLLLFQAFNVSEYWMSVKIIAEIFSNRRLLFSKVKLLQIPPVLQINYW